jgi:hypothetical protein
MIVRPDDLAGSPLLAEALADAGDSFEQTTFPLPAGTCVPK